MPRILGVDYGDRRLGFAISDETEMIAFPNRVETVRSVEQAVAAVEKVFNETKAVRIVVGYPINMNGTLGSRAVLTDAFMEKLAKKLAIPIEKWDERLSTRSAEAVLIEAGTSRKNRKLVVDKLAAQILLQNYLDAHAQPLENEWGDDATV